MQSRNPVIMTSLCLIFLMSNLVNMVMQSVLQSCLMEMRDPVSRLLKTWEDCALGESLIDIFKVACKSGLMTLPLAPWTVGPDVMCTMWEQCGRASG